MPGFAAFCAACSNGHVGVVLSMLQFLRSKDARDAGLKAAARAGQIRIISLLLSTPLPAAAGNVQLDAHEADDIPNSASTSALADATAAGQLESVLRILAHKGMEICDASVISAITNGHANILDRLLADVRSDAPLHPWNEFTGVATAIESERDALLDMLLADPRALPPGLYASPLTASIKRGDHALVARLLAHPTVSPDGPGENALVEAVRNPRVLDLILADGRTVTRQQLSGALSLAASMDNETLVHRLLAAPLAEDALGGGDPAMAAVDATFALEFACAAGRLAVVELLLTHPRTRIQEALPDMAGRPRGPMQAAAEHGHLAVMQRLLADAGGRFLPVDGVEAAAENGHLDVLELLLADPRFDPRVYPTKLDNALLLALARGHLLVAEALLPRCTLDFPISPHTAVCVAAQTGRPEVIDFLLNDARFDATGNACEPFLLALRSGSMSVVQRLMRIPGVHATLEMGWPLVEAAAGGSVKLVELLLGQVAVESVARGVQALLAACVRGHVEVVERLLAHPRVDPSVGDQEALFAAMSAGNEGIALRVLADRRVDPTARGSEAVALAARSGFWQLLRELLRHPRINAGVYNSVALAKAAAADQLDIVEELLAHPGVFAGAGDNEALIASADLGATSLVATLLARKGVDPSARNNKALMRAIRRRHVPVVQLLLADARVDPTMPDHEPFLAATGRGFSEIVESLLAHARYQSCSDRAAVCRQALVHASMRGRETIVRLLLQALRPPAAAEAASASGCDHPISDSFVPPTTSSGDPHAPSRLDDHRDGCTGGGTAATATAIDSQAVRNALCEAARYGHLDIVRLLLADARADPAADDSAALRAAAACGHAPEVVELLLADGRSDPAAKACDALLQAIKVFDERTALRLLADPRMPDISTVPQQHFLREAAQRGLASVVSHMLAGPHADAAAVVEADGAAALRLASQFGFTEVVKLLLLHPGGHINVPASWCLITAVLSGFTDTVSAILGLAGGRVDPVTDLHPIFAVGKPVGEQTREYYRLAAEDRQLAVAAQDPGLLDPAHPPADAQGAVDVPMETSTMSLYMRRLLRRSCPSLARQPLPPHLQPITAAEVPDLLEAAWQRRRHAVMARFCARDRK